MKTPIFKDWLEFCETLVTCYIFTICFFFTLNYKCPKTMKISSFHEQVQLTCKKSLQKFCSIDRFYYNSCLALNKTVYEHWALGRLTDPTSLQVFHWPSNHKSNKKKGSDYLSHLCNHKFRQCFQDNVNPLHDCGNETETVTHFFLYCSGFHIPRQTLLHNIRNIKKQILSQGKDQLI